MIKPFYEDPWVTIYCGDAMALLPQMGPAAAVVTDPPYGETSLEWDRWPNGWLRQLLGLTSQVWCFGSIRMFWDRCDEFAGWKLAQDIVWEKHNGSGLHADRFRRVHELAVHLYQGEWGALHHVAPVVAVDDGQARKRLKRSAKPQHFGGIEAGNAYEYGGRRIMRSVIPVASCHGYAEHPTQKPVGIVRPLIEYSVPVGGVVLDPFMGSGTTLVAARESGRKAIGIEMDEDYCRTAVRRLSQMPLQL